MKRCFLIFIVVVNHFLFGQSNIGNYVSNGSFEALNSYSASSYYICINYWQAIDTTKSSYYLATQLTPIANIPYQHGYQFPRTGKNYIIVPITYYSYFPLSRGYPRNRLKKNLKANTTYCVKFYLNSPNIAAQSTDSYGVYFGDNNLDTIKYCNIPLTYLNPQVQNQPGHFISDTLRWIPVTGTFVATGNEKYMVLGNFRSNANTSTLVTNTSTMALMYGIDACYDDVSVIEMNLPAYAGRDTAIIPGNPVFIGREPDFATDSGCVWYKWPNMTVPIDTISGLWVNPISTSTYIVKQTLECSPEKWDTVVVTVDPTVGINKFKPSTGPGSNFELEVFPNPATDHLEIRREHGKGKTENGKWLVSITNHLGQLMLKEEIYFEDQTVKVKITDLPDGVYFLELSGTNGILRKGFVIAK